MSSKLTEAEQLERAVEALVEHDPECDACGYCEVREALTGTASTALNAFMRERDELRAALTAALEQNERFDKRYRDAEAEVVTWGTVMTIKHWLAHRLHLNEGDVVSGWDGEHLFVWFQCRGCGKISGVHKAPDSLWQR